MYIQLTNLTLTNVGVPEVPSGFLVEAGNTQVAVVAHGVVLAVLTEHILFSFLGNFRKLLLKFFCNVLK